MSQSVIQACLLHSDSSATPPARDQSHDEDNESPSAQQPSTALIKYDAPVVKFKVPFDPEMSVSQHPRQLLNIQALRYANMQASNMQLVRYIAPGKFPDLSIPVWID